MPHRDIHLDFNFAMQDFVGSNGISVSELDQLTSITQEIHRGIHAMKEVGQLPFYHLSHDEQTVEQISQKSEDLKQRFETLVILGIGGSSLGANTLLKALQKKQSIKILVSDGLDPDSFSTLLESLDLKKTVFNVVSKSGETLETLAQFFIVQNLLKEQVGSKWNEHFVMTTDPEHGFLRKVANENQVFSFSIPPGVGGRFSVFSPVGLFPAAMGEVDIQELLAGARRGETLSSMDDLWLNPAYLLAALQYLMSQKGKKNLIIMPYSDRLFPLGEWYCQLWGESIGKRFSLKGEKIEAGSTPIAASGPRDQHSQLQLYIEGPKDKFVLFFKIENFEKNFPISISEELPIDEKSSCLKSQNLTSLLNAELFATATALAEEKCPSSIVTLPYCHAYGLGELMFLLQVTTFFAGGLYNVNPFDQPGVELAKKLTLEFLHKTTLNQNSPMMWRKLEKKFMI